MRNLLILSFLTLFTATQIACQKGKEVTTPGGNRVVVHTNNEGPKATYGNTILINVNTWVNDSLVQSTLRDAGGPREVTLPDSTMMKGRVPAVFEALLMMAKGDSATVYQPLDSVMKKGIPKSFGEVKEIRYEVKLEDIVTPEVLQQRQAEAAKKAEEAQAQGMVVAETVKTMLADYKSKKLANLKKSESGLEYVIIEQGAGAPLKDGDSVPTSYFGVRKNDGVMFDNSYDRGGPSPFTVGALIPGFNEGMKLLNRGGKALLFIPSKLGYGEQGAGGDIPPNTDLVFYIEMGM
ncbi:MAG: FKBP-type peptidyl-prolyl cis-trans isomerase [Saprospiraceae bacterium]|nr:FKBP-type peptidyl-prolyl cis-trans isomerase [Saprospiraceae bacterium]